MWVTAMEVVAPERCLGSWLTYLCPQVSQYSYVETFLGPKPLLLYYTFTFTAVLMQENCDPHKILKLVKNISQQE